jgi:peptidoglycan LD-endopeptidase LytH
MFLFRKPRRFFLLLVFIILLVGGIWLARRLYYSTTVRALISSILYGGSSEDTASNELIYQFLINPDIRAAASNHGGEKCPDAPFILPSSGFVGLLWRDPAPPYTVQRRHTGIDIFGDGAPGTIPIVAVYDGWLTRRDDWKSTVIIRHDDPLQPGQSIWSYYTHMASLNGSISFVAPEFPAGTVEKFVKQGTLLGYQGDYAGVGASAIAMHVHVSLVRSNAAGQFLNEAILDNTVDPSLYFRLPLNIAAAPQRPVQCLS